MNDHPVGTCSLCGCAVCVPSVWHGVVPPVPTCSGCGAVPANPHGPVMDMRPSKTYTVTSIRIVNGKWVAS